MPVKLVDNVKIYNTTTGTGAIVLGTPVPAYRGVEALTNGQVYSYSIHQGANFEYGRGTYLAAGQQLIRSPLASSTGGTALDLQPNAEVAFVALAEDIQNGPPALELFADRVTIANDSSGSPSPSTQTTTFSAIPFNFTGAVAWSLTDFDGTALTPVTDYLSSDTGLSVTMTAAQFTAGRGTTRGVIVTATPPSGSGAAARSWTVVGTDPGINAKTLTVTSSRGQIKYDSTGTATPATQTTTLTANKQNTTATVTWTIADLSGAAVTPASTYLSSDTGDSVTLTRVNFDSARGSTNGLTITATLTDGVTISDSTTIVATQDGAAGTNGADGHATTTYDGYGPPPSNLGVTGDYFRDFTAMVKYGPKTSVGWPATGEPFTVSAATGPATRTRVDLRITGATIPTNHITCTRNSTSTDMMPYDSYTYSYNTFAINTPVLKPGKGLIGTGARAQELLVTPEAPATETVTVPAGVVCVTAWGPAGSTYAVAAGTAVGTGFTTMAGDGGTALFLTITTGGTITLTPTGITKANVQYNPSLPSATEVVPFIPTQSIREADILAAGSALLPTFQSAQGYFLMGISDALIRNFGPPPTLLGLNNSVSIYVGTLSSVALLDTGGAATSVSLGSGSLKTGTTIGFTWDTTSTVTIGGGDKLEVSRGYRLNNNVAVTAASLLGAKTTANLSGQQGTTACLGWYEYDTSARLTDEATYAAYTPFKLPTIDDILKNWQGAGQFKNFLTAYRQMQAGIIDHVRIADFGSSHHAGTTGTVNVRGNGPTAQMVADLKAEGVYPVNDDCFGGMNGLAWTGGTNQYDGRMSYSGGTPTGALNQNGVLVIRLPAGCQITFTPTLNSSNFRLMYYTGSGYGNLEVSTDGGTTPIVPVEGGSATISTNAASSYQIRNFTATLGANAWTIKATGAAIDISFGYAYNPAAKQIVFGNFACYGYTAVGLSLDASPEQSVLGPLKQFAPHLCFGCSDSTNSMSPLLTWTQYSGGVAAILTAEKLTADVILYTDPPSDLSFVNQATQDTIFNYERALGFSNGLPMFDYAGWAQTWLRLPNGFYADTKHLEKRAVKRTKSNPQKALFKRIMALA